MANDSKRAIAVGVGVLGVGLLLFAVMVFLPREPEQPSPAPVTAAEPPGVELPPLKGERSGPSHRPPEAPSAPGENTDEGEGGEATDAAPSAVLEGPVGDVVAADLSTVALELPPGRPSLVTPLWSPDGKRLAAVSGKTTTPAVWVIDVDNADRGWIQVPAPEGVTEPEWLDSETLAMVRDGMLYSYKLGGRMFALVDGADEPGTVSAPRAAVGAQRVAYVSTTTTNGGGDIRVLDRTTSVVRDVTSTSVRADSPGWRPDGEALVGVMDGVTTAWELSSSGSLHRFPRSYPARVPGWYDGDTIHWQEGAGFAVNLVVARPPEAPMIVARAGLASVGRAAPVAGGFIWLSSLRDRGTLWAIRPDGSGVAIATDAMMSAQPAVIERGGTLQIAFTSAEEGTPTARIHLGRIDPKTLRME